MSRFHPPELVEKGLEMVRQGMSRYRVAKILNVSSSVVVGWVKNNGNKVHTAPKAPFPFEDYTYLIVIDPKTKQKVVQLKKGNKRTTTPYGRFIMSIREGRRLDKSEQVRRKNGNVLDDSDDNFYIHKVGVDRKSREVSCICVICETEFISSRNVREVCNDRYCRSIIRSHAE